MIYGFKEKNFVLLQVVRIAIAHNQPLTPTAMDLVI